MVVVCAIVGVAMTLSMIALVVTAAAGGALGMTPSERESVLIGLLVVQGLCFGGTTVAYWLVRGAPGAVGVRFPGLRDLTTVVVATVVALVGVSAAGMLVYELGLEPSSNEITVIGSGDPGLLLWLIPFAFLLIGPGEELLFRGFAQRRLREAFGPLASIAIAGAIFALVHAFALTDTWGQRAVSISVLFIPSVIFGYVYERTGNIVVPILVHAAYDAVLLYVAYAVMVHGA